MFHPSMKQKMDELEARKSALAIRIEEAKRQAEINSPSRDQIYYYLSQDADIKNKSLEDQKRIIQTYVCRIVVFDNHIETDTIVSFDGGGEGSRTIAIYFTYFILLSHIFLIVLVKSGFEE